MKTIRILTMSAMLAVAALLAAPVAITGCKTAPSRNTYNTIASLAMVVDVAEREYLDQVIAGEAGTNNFTQIQAGYAAFQESLRLTLAISMNDSNALAPVSLSAAAARLLLDIQAAKGDK